MASTFNISNTTANAQANAAAALCNSGYLNIYSGTQPANANTALSGNTLLATLRFGATAWGAPANGVLTANAIIGANAIATGTATFARALESDDATVVFDCSIGTIGSDINLNTTALVSGQPVQVTSLTWTVTE